MRGTSKRGHRPLPPNRAASQRVVFFKTGENARIFSVDPADHGRWVGDGDGACAMRDGETAGRAYG